MRIHHRTCNLCEAHCGLIIETEDRRIVSIRADEDDPLSQGYMCPKGYALKDLYEDPDRLRRPLIRTGESWREASWEEAIAAAARGLHEVQKRHGADALASYVGNPTAHNLAAMLSLPAFLRLLGTRNKYSASSVDQFPKMLSAYLMFGGQLSVAVPDVDRTSYFLILGANPLVSNGSLMTAPDMKRRLRELRSRGGRIVVVDPRRTETAAAATDHVFIRPGTDALLLLALINVVFEENLVRLGAADGRIDGVEHMRELAYPFTPERVQGATAVPAADIRRIARQFAAADGAACYTRIGTCVQEYGTLASFLGDVLNLITGNVDRVGGMMFPNPAVSYSSKGSYRRWKSRVRGLVEFGGELPVACLAEEIETEGQGRIRGLFTMAGNPVLSTPNGRRLEAALATLDFMVSVDPALNETTRFANVVLPPRHALENSHFSLVFHKLAVRDTVKFCDPVFEPDEDSLSEWEITARLSAELVRLRNEDAVAAGKPPVPNPTEAHFSATPEQFIEMLLAGGPYGLTLEEIRARPAGIDLGPLKEGGLDRALRHEDGRIHLQHEEIDAEVARLSAQLAAGAFGGDGAAGNGFLLIGRRQLRSNNSWMHNCASLIKGPERCTLLMHPSDATRLGLKHGRTVSVASRVGEVSLALEVTEEMMPGVVSMPHGFGHSREGTRMKLASAKPGASMNDLTDEAITEGLVGNGVLTGVPVRVSAFERGMS
ncbi:MAG TPA: molybdopterin-dependent oxidoreductase [Candidatus Limnocylindrales bacterium]|nr:molybdopterin-dependent oxidoreductase [Candidatus Limnocylindrales bacterium]